MKRVAIANLCVTLCALLGAAHLQAAALEKASVTRVFNEVRLLDPNKAAREAKPGDEISGQAAVRTGTGSKSELVFSDNTLARMGANTIFSFDKGTRDMNLENGTILLQVPKDAGGARIRTAAVTAAITGTTIMMEYVKGANGAAAVIKVLALEGTVKVAIAGRLGEWMELKPGQMLILPADARELPDAPVNFDIFKIYETSGLIRGFNDLPSDRLIDDEVDRQNRRFVKGDLKRTNLVILGKGGKVNFANGDNLLTIKDATENLPQPEGTGVGNPPNDPPGGGGPGTPGDPGNPGDPLYPGKRGPAPTFAGLYEISNLTTVITDPTIDNQSDPIHEGRIFVPEEDGPFSEYLYGSTDARDLEAGLADVDFLPGPTGVFKFEEMAFAGGSVVFDTTNGPTSVAFLAQYGAYSGDYGSLLDVTPLDFFLLATQDGGINFTNSSIIGGENSSVYFYAKGGGEGGGIDIDADVDIGGTFTLNASSIYYNQSVIQAGTIRIIGDYVDGGWGSFILGAEEGDPGLYATNLIEITAGSINISGNLEAPEIKLLSENSTYLTAASATANFISIQGSSVNIEGTYIETAHPAPSSSPPPPDPHAGRTSIDIHSTATSGQGILINDSSTLRALVNWAGQGGKIALRTEGGSIEVLEDSLIESQGGPVEITSKGGNITVDQSSILANNGTLIIDTVDALKNADVLLNNATLSADVLKIRAYGPNGTLTINGNNEPGTTLSAQNILRLYADGSNGRISFEGDTIINNHGDGVIAAKSVDIGLYTTVTVNGNVIKVYTDNANYSELNGGNGSGGQFDGPGAPTSKSPFGDRPAF